MRLVFTVNAARARGPDVAETGNYTDIDGLLSRGQGGLVSSVVCGALAGSLTLEGSDVGDRGVCWAGLGWAGLGCWEDLAGEDF